MVISMIHAGQAGIRRTLRLLKALAFRPQADNQHMDAFTLEAYSHIDEKYLEQTHQ